MSSNHVLHGGFPLESVDLFCGAGGLTSGLERAGFGTIAAVDANRDAMATLRATQSAGVPVPGSRRTDRYLAGARLLEADISEVRGADLRPPGAARSWRPTLLAGGPPCQPFSSAGKQRGVEDPRGTLFLDFVRIADELRPAFILLENVRGLVTAKCPDGQPGGVLALVQKSFEEIGYACRFAVLNAADFGAPQRRVRLFMFAAAEYDLPSFPEATHSRNPDRNPLLGLSPWTSLGSALEALPEPSDDDVVVPTGERAQQLLALDPGTGLRSGGIVEANRPGGHWGYRQDSFRADLELPARTIRAASTPDWIEDRRGRFRRLTWRECAALQGFPAEWRFQGSLASRFRQIGNAVHGGLAHILGSHLANHCAVARPATPRSPPWPAYFIKRVKYTEMEHRVNGAHRAAASAAQ